ncbi:MAG: substrate-binding domain-containing protein [Kiritimatiellia bacterium]
MSQSVEFIENKITAGVFSGTMPTEHELSSQLLVSRNTIRAAYSRLESDQWISPARQGTRRKILKFFPRKDGEPPFKIGYLAYDSLDRMRPNDLAMLETLRAGMLPLNGNIEVVISTGLSNGDLESSLELLVRQTAADAWIIVRGPAQLQRWFGDKGLPTILLGTAVDGVAIHCVDCDWYRATQDAVQRLIGAGHRRILYAGPRDRLEGVRRAEEGFQDILNTLSATATGMIVRHDAKGGRKDAFADELRGMFMQAERPTAVITHRAGEAMALLGVLNDLRLRVGTDVALISMEFDELFNDYRPSICGYRTRQADRAPHLHPPGLDQEPRQSGRHPRPLHARIHRGRHPFARRLRKRVRACFPRVTA